MGTQEQYQIPGRAAAAPGILATGITNARRGLALLREWLLDPNVTIVGHNVWYDLGVCISEDPSLLPLVFAKLESGQIVDTMVRQQLLDIADGNLKFVYDDDGEVTRTSYHLNDLSYRLLHRYLKKEDTWRLKYALLDGVPLTQWPEEAVTYSILDSVVTLDIYNEQEAIATSPTSVMVTMRDLALVAPPDDPFDDRVAAPSMETIINSAAQHRAAFALYLMSLWGVRTDPEAVAELKKHLEEERAGQMVSLRPSGLFKITPARALKAGPRKGEVVPEEITRNMKVIKERVAVALTALGLDVPRTDGGQISTSRKTLKSTKSAELITLAEVGATEKLLQTYVPVLERGGRVPINARYNVLQETGRSSCSSPNVQNLPRG